MKNRKFYKTVIQVEILSEEPYSSPTTLDQIHYDITFGDCSGYLSLLTSQELSRKDFIEEVFKQGSDPGFFNLQEDGTDLE